MKRVFLLTFLTFFIILSGFHIISEHSEKECILSKSEKHFHKDPTLKFCNFCLNVAFFIFINLIYLFLLLFFEKNTKSPLNLYNFEIPLIIRAPPFII